MKKDFMEIFGEIDEKYLMEAANTDCEEYGAEEIRSVNTKKRLVPSVVKYAACFVLVGAAAFTAYKLSAGSANPLPNAPLSSDYISQDTEEAEGTEKTEEADETENTVEETADFTQDFASQTTDAEEEAKKEADLNEWRSRTLVSPADVELPEYYSPYTSGWSCMLIYADEGAEVKAISYGEVVFAGYKEPDPLEGTDNNCDVGYRVVIKHNDHVYTEYSFLSSDLLVETGDTVEAGQPLGYVCGYMGRNEYAFGMEVATFDLSGDKFYNVRKRIEEDDRKDWSRTLVNPVDCELPDNYSAMRAAAGSLSGWASMVIPAPQGSEVRAISYGDVVFADYQEANTYHAHNEYIIVIKHNYNVYTAYSTLSPEASLKAGDHVEAGQRIGYVDSQLFDGDGEYGFVFYAGAVNFAENK